MMIIFAYLIKPLKTVCLTICFILLLFVVQDSSGEEPVSGKDTIRIGYMKDTFSDVSVKDAKIALEIWTKMILKKSGKEFVAEHFVFEDTAQALEAINNNRVDVLGMSPLDYFTLKGKAPVEVVLTVASGGKILNKFIILVNKNRDIKSLKQLKGQKVIMEMRGKGLLAKMWLDTLLMKEGLPASDRFLESVEGVDKVTQAILPVYFDQAGACIVTESAFDTASELNPGLKKGLKVLFTSPGFVGGIMSFREGYSVENKKIVEESALALQEDAEGRQILLLFRVDKMVPMDLKYLENVKDMIEEYNLLKEKI